MDISEEDLDFLTNVVRDYWTPAYLNVIPADEKDHFKEVIEKGKISDVIFCIPSWGLFRFLSEKGYTSRLIARRNQLWIKDRYGDIDPDPWFNELKQFIQKRIDQLELACKVPKYCVDAACRHSCTGFLEYNDKEFLFMAINKHVDDVAWEEEEELEDVDDPTDGHQFEHYVARILERNGWSVQHTGKSGDQGADVLIEKGGIEYAIQCKYSTYPIGNSAIQEAHAGRGFHRIKCAAVVTNSEFTRAARQLAASLGVDLIHVKELSDL